MPVKYLLSGKIDVTWFLISLVFCVEEHYREALEVVKEENQKLFDEHMKLLSEEALKVFFVLFLKTANCVTVGIHVFCIINYFNSH